MIAGTYKLLLLVLLISVLNFSCEKEKDPVIKSVVINELMAVNSTIVADQNGEFDDWFELYNITTSDIDISGYYLSDNDTKTSKWKIPAGTIIKSGAYLIIWADKDTTQAGLHANFKLSSAGEELVLSEPDLKVIDEVKYPEQTLELSYSRIPDGTGQFKWQNPTFNTANNISK
jgi:hypothetical protein